MGCDGGTIPKRHELVRTKKKAEQKDKNADLVAKWKHCALSNEILIEPIVACELGRLYNKDAVIEYLLDKGSEKVEKMNHIKGLKDIHTLNLHANPSWKNKTDHAEKGDAYIDDQNAKYICPVAGIEMNGRYKFCYLRTCGCVFSNRALKEVRDEICLTCSKKYSAYDDVITLNGSKDEEDLLRQKLEARKSASKSDRKKKRDKAKNGETNGHLSNGHSEKIDEDKPSTSGISTTKKQNGKIGTKSNHVKKLEVGSAVNGAKRRIEEAKIYKSDTFKSLFTSHSSAKRSKDEKAHWITYNPYHC
uniref:replication termination factor 2-like n=1 Tax=Styela clava TaxID=7725 RepID=UPI00193AC456|nr:replication termination factor 2-like [Styela clava]